MSNKHDRENRSNQMNPNNDLFWQSRGFDGRPDDWKARIERGDAQTRISVKVTPPRG